MINQIFAFLFGSIVGSFLNVCIYRLPKGESVVMPRSHCPVCNKTIRGYDNIPFLSYILLGGKCRFCKTGISVRYFIVELVTALFFLFLYNQYGRYGLVFDCLSYAVLGCGLIVATFVDIQLRIIPDEISVGGLIVGLLFGFLKGISLEPLAYRLSPFFHAFLGAIVGGGIIFLTGFFFDLVYFKMLKKPPVEGETSSMGGGDVKLLAMIGAFLGWQHAVLVFFLAPFFGIFIAIANLLIKKQHVIPYGPFLSLAAFLAIFRGSEIIGFLLRGIP
ncbi:MAG: prepilin peptidase [Candidatus Omnitrophota bacterium]|jgi:leader peptidase (prepilin peptidase)/N-methyltransferase